MKRLTELLDPGCVVLELHGHRKKQVLQELVQRLYQAEKLPDSKGAVKALLQREQLGSTGIGQGIAIPHALLAGDVATALAFGRSSDGVRFDAIDDQPVRLLFLLVGRRGEEALHLRLLCKLSRILHHERLREEFLQAPSPQTVIHLLDQHEPHGPC